MSRTALTTHSSKPSPGRDLFEEFIAHLKAHNQGSEEETQRSDELIECFRNFFCAYAAP